MEKVPLRIDIVSDVVCPWCIIGFKRLQRALHELEHQVSPEFQWHPFELNPAMPEDGQNLREHLVMKYGTTLEQSVGACARIAQIGASLGFRFDYYDDMRMYNTFIAHQLLYWAQEFGKQMDLEMRLFSVYFSERKSLGNINILVEAAADVGLNSNNAREVLEVAVYAERVRETESQWANLGINAVPAFILQQKYLITGAQDTEVFKQQIENLIPLAA